jgi:hypothetical protein
MPKLVPEGVKLPEGGEIVPEHFHEGPEATRMFQRGVRTVLSVDREELKRREDAWKKLQAKKKRKRG